MHKLAEKKEKAAETENEKPVVEKVVANSTCRRDG